MVAEKIHAALYVLEQDDERKDVKASQVSDNMTTSVLKLLSLLTLICFFNADIFAQAKNNAWFRGTMAYKVSTQLTADIEVQHRRQSGFTDHMILGHNLMYSLRTWIHYLPANELKISISPFARFSHYHIIEKAEDEIYAPAKETRFSIAALWQKDLFARFSLINRNAIEYRILSNQSRNIVRWRNRAGLQYNIKPGLSFLLYDEVFVNAAGVQPGHLVDHNRLGTHFECKCLSQLKAEFGYIYINRLPLSGTNWLKENNLMLNITFDLPN